MKVIYFGENSPAQEMFSLGLRLKWPDISIVPARTAGSGLAELAKEPADLVCLCPDFENMPLVETIRAVRQITKAPLMVLSQGETAFDAVVSLNTGADEYIGIPFDLNELVARVWALIRRSGSGWSVAPPSPITHRRLLLSPATREAFLGQQKINLTNIETQVLDTLVKNRTTIMPIRTLIEEIWGQHSSDTSSRVKKCIQRLRKKLGDDATTPTWIANVHGVGYRFIGPATEDLQAEYEP